MVFRLTEYILIALILLVFASQIAWPLYKGRPIFPFFRKQRQLEKNLADANQARFEEGLRKKIEETQPRPTDNTQ